MLRQYVMIPSVIWNTFDTVKSNFVKQNRGTLSPYKSTQKYYREDYMFWK